MARSERGASLQWGRNEQVTPPDAPSASRPTGCVSFGAARRCSLGRDGKDIDTALAPLASAKRTATRPTPEFQQSPKSPSSLTNIMSHRSIIVLPDDTGKPIIDAINAAKKSVRVKMFIFSDPDLIKAVINAQRTRAQDPGHAQSRAPERRRGECRDAQGARESRHRSQGQQPRVRHHARKIAWSWTTKPPS